jgi:hypothetical protein
MTDQRQDKPEKQPKKPKRTKRVKPAYWQRMSAADAQATQFEALWQNVDRYCGGLPLALQLEFESMAEELGAYRFWQSHAERQVP